MNQTDNAGTMQAKVVNATTEAAPPKPFTDPTQDIERFLTTYKAVLKFTFLAALLVAGILVVLFMTSYWLNQGGKASSSPSLLLVVALCGSLGALFSALTRLYALNDLPAALMSEAITKLASKELMIYSLSSPVVGCIAAVVLYLVFAGQIVSGEAFPAFTCKAGDGKCTSLALMMDHWGPNEAKDYAKALIWGFVAGFSERLIPDTLQTISTTVQMGEKKS